MYVHNGLLYHFEVVVSTRRMCFKKSLISMGRWKQSLDYLFATDAETFAPASNQEQ